MRMKSSAGVVLAILTLGGCAQQEQCRTQISEWDQFPQNVGNLPRLRYNSATMNELTTQVGSCVAVSRFNGDNELLAIEPDNLLKSDDGMLLIFGVTNMTEVAIIAKYDNDRKLQHVYVY